MPSVEEIPALDGMKADPIETNDDLVDSICDQLEAAESEVLIGTQPKMLDRIEDSLRQCYQNGTFVALCLYGDDDPHTGYDFDDLATLVRVWGQELDTLVSVDHQRGVVGQLLDEGEEEDVVGLEYDTERLYGMAMLQFMSQHWDNGEEVYVTPARTLPYDCANLRDAALNATLHLRENNPVGFEAEAREAPAQDGADWLPMTGQVSSTRQSYVDPSTNSFFGEVGLIGYTDAEGRVTMGGHGAYFEDYEVRNITLTPL